MLIDMGVNFNKILQLSQAWMKATETQMAFKQKTTLVLLIP